IHNRSGHLRETAASPLQLKGSPVAVVTHPERAVTYVASKNPGNIQVYHRQDLAGTVAAIQSRVISTSEPVQLHLDSSGRDLFVVTKTGLMKCPLEPSTGKITSCAAERVGGIPTAVSTIP
ncbi:MAG: hypothetical protein V3R49_06205, partial [Gammaproteobacteria bacterium]